MSLGATRAGMCGLDRRAVLQALDRLPRPRDCGEFAPKSCFSVPRPHACCCGVATPAASIRDGLQAPMGAFLPFPPGESSEPTIVRSGLAFEPVLAPARCLASGPCRNANGHGQVAHRHSSPKALPSAPSAVHHSYATCRFHTYSSVDFSPRGLRGMTVAWFTTAADSLSYLSDHSLQTQAMLRP
jgi:hypothetical protein